MKRRVVLSVVTVLLVLLSAGSAMAEPIAIIVNANNPVSALTISEVKRLYENDTLTWPNGRPVVLYDLRVKDEVRKRFSGIVLGKEPKIVAREWARKKITNMAKNPPMTLKAASLVQKYVGRDAYAIGYLLKGQVTSTAVKIVLTIE